MTMHTWLAAAVVGLTLCVPAPTLAQGDAGSGPARARLNFMQHCSGCHLATGRGAPDKGIPSMRGGVLATFLSTPAGRSYLLSVPGVLNTPLDVSATTELMNWVVRNFADSDGPYAPFQEHEVVAARANRLQDPVKTRAELLAR